MTPAGSRVTDSRLTVAGRSWTARYRLGLTVVVLALLPGTVTAADSGWTGGSAAPGSGVDAAAPQSLPESVTVTLATGDRVRLDTAGQGVHLVTPVPAAVDGVQAGSFVQYTAGGDQYVVPDVAVPYLNSTLDPRLFDVSYLAKAGLLADNKGLPVTVTYDSAAATAADLPGLSVTKRSGDTASAILDPAQSAKLGQALADQWHAVRSGHSTLPLGKLPGISRVSLAAPAYSTPANGAPPGPAGTPDGQGLPYYTVTLHFIDLTGAPAAYLGGMQNVEDAALATSLVSDPTDTLVAGTASLSVSVPAGTYSFEFSVLTPHATGLEFDTALVVRPEVTVHSDQTVNLDARAAVPYQANLDQPVSASVREDSLSYIRSSIAGGASSAGGGTLLVLFAIAPNPAPGVAASRLLATPTTRVYKGAFGFDASTQLSNTVDGFQGPEPGYFFDFPSVGGIPRSLTFAVARTDLTSVDEHIYDSPPSSCSGSWHDELRPAIYPLLDGQPWISVEWGFSVTHGSRTDYWYTSDPELDLWEPTFTAGGDCTAARLRRTDVARHLPHGGRVSEVWNKAPLVSGPVAPYAPPAGPAGGGPNDVALSVCPACRQDDNAVLYLTHRGDSAATHFTRQYTIPDRSSTVAFYRDGVLALTSAAEFDGTLVPVDLNLAMLPAPATYRLDWAWASPADPAASTETDWTFRSSPSDPAARLPNDEECGPDTTRACSFLPLLFVGYDLALNDEDQTTAGQPFEIPFRVGAQQNAPAPTGVTATVAASFDDGRTWTDPQAATVRGDGRFTTTISQPALRDTTGFVSLRVTAADRAGNTVTQTVIRAYGLAD